MKVQDEQFAFLFFNDLLEDPLCALDLSVRVCGLWMKVLQLLIPVFHPFHSIVSLLLIVSLLVPLKHPLQTLTSFQKLLLLMNKILMTVNFKILVLNVGMGLLSVKLLGLFVGGLLVVQVEFESALVLWEGGIVGEWNTDGRGGRGLQGFLGVGWS